MRVLFISGGDYKYGAPKSMITLIEGLKEKYGIEPILLTKKHNELNNYCDQHGIENYSFWYRDIMAGSPYSNKLLTMMKHVVKFFAYIWGGITQSNISKLPIDFSTVDIIHTNTNRQDIGVYISKKYSLKHVWHIREMGKEDYNVLFYKRECIQYMNKHADAYIMISKIVKNKWESIGLLSKKMHVIPDGMDIEKISKKHAREDSNIKIVITGHVQPNKGQLQIVEAISILPDEIKRKVRLDIIGEAYPDYKKKIEQVISEKGLQDQIKLLGYRNGIGEILSEYDIGITCSKAEALGRCTIEYMLAGLLTVASDTGANSELIENGKTGILYKYADIEELSEKLCWIAKHKIESEQIADAGHMDAKWKYSKEQCADKVYEVYQNVL